MDAAPEKRLLDCIKSSGDRQADSSVSVFVLSFASLHHTSLQYMVYVLTQGDGWLLKGRTGCVKFVTHQHGG